MEKANQNPQVIRFATFEVDLGTGELRKGGLKLKLRGQPFQVLAILLERPGQIVARDELHKRLWPDTFVDVDHNLNTAINKIREVLGDSAENPRFIETLSRRGYRFIGALNGGVHVQASGLAVGRTTAKTWPLSGLRIVAGVGAAMLLTVLGVAGWFYWSSGGIGKGIDSVAVLPFENVSGDPNTDYLGDGIAESLIDSLSQIPHLKVISRDSAFHYRGKESDAQTVGRVLGVRALFKGWVVQRGDTLTLSAELIDARDNSHIWGQQYSRKPSDILALQEEVTKEMTTALRVRLTGKEEHRLTKTYTTNPEAYEDYLKGRYWFNKQTEEGFHKGINYFEQAIAKDPSYSLAYAGLADCHVALANFGLVSAKEGYANGKAWVEKALKLDETLAEAHVSLAYIKTGYEWDWSGGEKESERAIELNPAFAPAHAAHGEVLWTTGRMDESIQESKLALQLDPLSIEYNDDLGFEFFMARQYDQAIEQQAKTLELDPKYIPAYYFRGVAYVKKFMYKEAMAEFEKAVAISPDDLAALTGIGYGYAVMGRRSEAEKVLGRLDELSKREFVSPVWTAKIYSGLGEKDKAFKALEEAYEDRSLVSVAFIKTNPMLDPLRSDPRFAELLRRVNLPP